MALSLLSICCILRSVAAVFLHSKDPGGGSEMEVWKHEEAAHVAKTSGERVGIEPALAQGEAAKRHRAERVAGDRKDWEAADRRRQERAEKDRADEAAANARRKDNRAIEAAVDAQSEAREAELAEEATRLGESERLSQADRSLNERLIAEAKATAKLQWEAKGKEATEEKEVAYLLAAEADRLRQEAEIANSNSTTLKQMLKGVSQTDMVGMLTTATKEAAFMQEISKMDTEGSVAIARFARHIKVRAEEFSVAATASDLDEKFQQLMSRFIEEEFAFFKVLAQNLTSMSEAVQKGLPATLATTIQPVALMALPKLDALSKVQESLKTLNISAACSELPTVMTEILPFHDNVRQGRAVLNAAASGFSATASSTRLTSQVKTFVSTAMKLGYMANLALETAAKDLSSVAMRVVGGKLHCSFSAASPTSLSLLAVASSLLAAWLLI